MGQNRSVFLVHAIPGRVRVRLGKGLRSPEEMNALVETLSRVEGIREVRANPTIGSLLILYDPKAIGMESLVMAAAAADIEVVIPEADRQPPSAELSDVARGINSAFGRLDRAVARATDGKLDAKTLAPLALGAVAVRRILTSGADLSAVPWYVLLWYSFEMFTKYNLRRGSGPGATPAAGAT